MGPNGHIVVLLYPHLFTNTPDNSGCHVLSGLGLPTETMSYLNVLWLNHETDLLDNTISSEVAIAKQAGVNIDIADPRQAVGDNEVTAGSGQWWWGRYSGGKEEIARPYSPCPLQS